jgi:hypothetical protein
MIKEQLQEYHAWLNLCRMWASSCGCPEDYVQDEQRWAFMFLQGLTAYAAVQEDLKEEVDMEGVEPIAMSKEQIDRIVERVLYHYGADN